MNDGLLSDMMVLEPQGEFKGGLAFGGSNITFPFGKPNGQVPALNFKWANAVSGSWQQRYNSINWFDAPGVSTSTIGIGGFNHSIAFWAQEIFLAKLTYQGLTFTQYGSIQWTNGAVADGTVDLGIYRDAAYTLAQRFGANAQGFNLYNTYTSATNFERLDLQWASNICKIWTEKGSGGGTARPLVLGADATELLRFDTGSTIGFFAATPVVKQTSGANLTNNVTSGGTTDTITDWTNLSTYSTDAAAIRNAVYQLSRKVKQLNDGLRAYGLFT